MTFNPSYPAILSPLTHMIPSKALTPSLLPPQASVEAGDQKMVSISFHPPRSWTGDRAIEASTNVSLLLLLLLLLLLFILIFAIIAGTFCVLYYRKCRHIKELSIKCSVRHVSRNKTLLVHFSPQDSSNVSVSYRQVV